MNNVDKSFDIRQSINKELLNLHKVIEEQEFEIQKLRHGIKKRDKVIGEYNNMLDDSIKLVEHYKNQKEKLATYVYA